MPIPAERILEALSAVERERAARALDEGWSARVQAIKVCQQQRFMRTYADLLASARYEPAARFFLDELYGPRDFSDRDAQFARIVPTLVRLLPHEIIETMAGLTSLHALSESLDSDMARGIAMPQQITCGAYVAAWQACGRAADRRRQIALTLEIGDALDRYTRRPLLRQSLRMMRAPAKAAGLSGLQRFLEAGFEAFGAMRGADDFLALVGSRERAVVAALFSADGACNEHGGWLSLSSFCGTS